MEFEDIERMLAGANLESILALLASDGFWDSEGEVLLRTALMLRERGFQKDSLRLAKEIGLKVPHLKRDVSLRLKYLCGDLLLDLCSFQEAVDCYSELLSEHPDGVAYGNRGLAHWELGEFQAALLDYSEAAQLNPQNVVALRGLGEMYIKVGKPDEAVPYLLEAIRLKADYAEAYTALGVARHQTGSWALAYKCLQKAISLNPSDSIAADGIEKIEKYFEI